MRRATPAEAGQRFDLHVRRAAIRCAAPGILFVVLAASFVTADPVWAEAAHAEGASEQGGLTERQGDALGAERKVPGIPVDDYINEPTSRRSPLRGYLTARLVILGVVVVVFLFVARPSDGASEHG